MSSMAELVSPPSFRRKPLLLFLLEQAERNLNERARDRCADHTRQHASRGGIRDHMSAVAFIATPSTRAWRVPHFEKMLYNQALLIAQSLDPGLPHDGTHVRYAGAALTELLGSRHP